MFNILVNAEYEVLYEKLVLESPEFFKFDIVDFKTPNHKLNHFLLKPMQLLDK